MIAMALDIRLAEISNGEQDLINMVLGLIEEYGMTRPFKDNELFDVIADRSAPSIRDFFRDHVEASEPIPFEALFETCGLDMKTESGSEKPSFGPIKMKFDAETGYLNVSPGEGNLLIDKDLVISKLNGEELSFKLIRSVFSRPKTHDPLEITHIVDGEEQILTLIPKSATGSKDFKILPKESMTEAQQKIYDKLFTAKDRG